MVTFDAGTLSFDVTGGAIAVGCVNQIGSGDDASEYPNSVAGSVGETSPAANETIAKLWFAVPPLTSRAVIVAVVTPGAAGVPEMRPTVDVSPFALGVNVIVYVRPPARGSLKAVPDAVASIVNGVPTVEACVVLAMRTAGGASMVAALAGLAAIAGLAGYEDAFVRAGQAVPLS